MKRKPSGRKGSRAATITFVTKTEHTIKRSEVKAAWDNMLGKELYWAARDNEGSAIAALRSMKFDVFLDKYFTQQEWESQNYINPSVPGVFFDDCFWNYYDDLLAGRKA